MKETSEGYLGTTAKNATVAVPAYLNNSQRQATKDTVKISDPNVLRAINKPTAAALAYGMDKVTTIFNPGSGTLHTSIFKIQKGIFKVKSTKGITFSDSNDSNNELLPYLVMEFKRKQGINLAKGARALHRSP